MGLKCKVTGDDVVCPECGESVKERLEAGLGICEHMILTDYKPGEWVAEDGSVVCEEIPIVWTEPTTDRSHTGLSALFEDSLNTKPK